MVCALTLAAVASRSLGTINGVVYSNGGGSRIALNFIDVQRGASNYSYSFANLLSPTLDAVSLSSTGSSAILLYADPLDSNRDKALSDAFINTGFLDPGQGSGSFTGLNAKYIKLKFGTPVKNDVGPDLVVFGIGWQYDSGPNTSSASYISFDGTTAYSVNRNADFQLPQIPNTPYYAYNGGVSTPNELVTKTPQLVGYLGNPPTAIPRPVVHALDLSNYGVAAGAAIDTMYLQDATSGSNLYPTLIAGLPAIPEPAAGLFMIVGVTAALWRRHR